MKLTLTLTALSAAASGVAANDECTDAIAVIVPSTTPGSTVGATLVPPGLCSIGSSSPATWYKVVGTGNLMTATTCTAGTNYDTGLSVFCTGCIEPTCVGTNDDDTSCGFSFFRSTVNWCGEEGVEYSIMVHGYDSTSAGSYELDISDNGSPCAPTSDAIDATNIFEDTEQATHCAESSDVCGLNHEYVLCKCAIQAGNGCEWNQDNECVSI